MESNPLLEAMQDDTRLGGIKNFERVVNQSSHEYLKNCILDLLRLQMELCAEEAEIDSTSDLFENAYIIKDRILNAKLFNNE